MVGGVKAHEVSSSPQTHPALTYLGHTCEHSFIHSFITHANSHTWRAHATEACCCCGAPFGLLCLNVTYCFPLCTGSHSSYVQPALLLSPQAANALACMLLDAPSLLLLLLRLLLLLSSAVPQVRQRPALVITSSPAARSPASARVPCNQPDAAWHLRSPSWQQRQPPRPQHEPRGHQSGFKACCRVQVFAGFETAATAGPGQ
jgi:hypothetical protein